MTTIFISHSSRDDDVAAEVRGWLVAQGHQSVFLDFDPELGIPAGRDWERELYQQLRSCRAVIAVLQRGVVRVALVLRGGHAGPSAGQAAVPDPARRRTRRRHPRLAAGDRPRRPIGARRTSGCAGASRAPGSIRRRCSTGIDLARRTRGCWRSRNGTPRCSSVADRGDPAGTGAAQPDPPRRLPRPRRRARRVGIREVVARACRDGATAATRSRALAGRRAVAAAGRPAGRAVGVARANVRTSRRREDPASRSSGPSAEASTRRRTGRARSSTSPRSCGGRPAATTRWRS